MRVKLAAGNWKMNGLTADLAEIDALAAMHPDPKSEVLICPPATLIAAMARARRAARSPWARNPATRPQSGAHTGDLSAAMLADAGASHVIVGHSERRADHGERNDDVRAQARAVLEAGLKVIVCVGETEAQRDASNTLEIISGQLAGSVPDLVTGENLIVAYEPVWAIGTGRTPTTDQIGEVHDFIRAKLRRAFRRGRGPVGPAALWRVGQAGQRR
jgi:triosephosphate isomerase